MGNEQKVAQAIGSAGQAGNTTNQSALAGIRARVIEVNKSFGAGGEPGQSTVMPDDPFKALAHDGKIIEPPFDLLTLALLPEHSTELGQCIEAMETNIEGFGHRFVPRIKDSTKQPAPSAIKLAVRKERVKLENFFMYATRESFTKFRRKVRKDLETTGNGYFEVIRSAGGSIQSFVHIPSYQMRLGKVEDNMRKVKRSILELQVDGSVKVVTIPEYRRFRMFVQSKSIQRRNMSLVTGGKMRWFKEFGDPQKYNNETGEIATASTPDNKLSNEIVHLNLYSARSPYGLPRFIGNLLSIFGDRAAEEINFITFRNNNIPSMVVAVSNGQLTDGTIARIESFVESQIQGSDNYSKFLILEAETLMEGEDGNQVKMDIKPLVSQQHKDALFQEYSKNNQDKIRRCFRLPPIFVGRSDEYTRSTAESSRRLADEQIFAPERDEFDAFMNRIIFPEMAVIYHQFKSNSPNTTDNTQLVKILAGGEKTGGMTPRIAKLLLEDILGRELPDFAEGYDPDVPFSLTMAEAVKNKGDAAEPGQQVTALKAADFVSTGNAMIDHLLAVQKATEDRWLTEVFDELGQPLPEGEQE